MKKFKLWTIACFLLIAGACKESADKALAGIYVSQFHNQYGDGRDTLIITSINLSAQSFQVEERISYKLIRDGKVLPETHEQKHWDAFYNKDRRVLQEGGDLGKQIYKKDGEQQLQFGDRVYRKID
ncbi:MAG: hypothetical protein ACTHMI_14055 [Mucilaginibacter sp.]